MPTSYLPKLDFQSYVHPQQAVPVEDFNNLGVALNKRYDENIAKWDELDAYMNQLQLSDVDKSIKDSVIADTRNVLKDIKEKGNWENAKLPIREVAKRLANDQSLSIAQQNYKNSLAQRQKEGELRMQGHNLIDFNPDKYNQTTIDPFTKQARVLDYNGSEKLLEYDARRKSLFEGLTPDGYSNESSGLSAPDPNTGAIYQVGSGSGAKYVTAKKVKEIANRNLGNYLESAEGQQELKMLTTRNSMNKNPMSAKDAREVILNNITNTGLTRVFNQTQKSSSMGIAFAGNLGQLAPVQAGIGDLEGGQIEGNQANPVFSSLASKMGEGAVLLVKDDKGTEREVPWYQPFLDKGSVSMKLSYNTKDRLKTLTGEEYKMIERVATSLGIKTGNGKYSKGDLDKIKQFVTERQNTGVGLTVHSFKDEEITNANKYLKNGNYADNDRMFYSFADKKFLPFNQLPKEDREALTTGDGNKAIIQGVYDVDNPFRDLANSTKQFKNTKNWVSPESLLINGKRYATSASLTDVSKTDISYREAQQKISKANRTGVPLYLGKGKDKELVVPIGNNMYQLKKPDGSIITTPKNTQGLFSKEQIATYALTNKYDIED